MEKSFKDYILLAKREYKYRIKCAFELTEDRFSRLEKVCEKYGVVDISKPTRIIISKNPLDFKNVENAEVYYTDVTCEYPASTELFHQELRQALNVAEKLVIVRCENDPYEQEIVKTEAFDEKDEKGEYKTKLLDPTYESDGAIDVNKELYSQDRNDKLVQALGDSRKDAKKATLTMADGKTTPKGEDFNADVKKGKGNKSPFNTIELAPMPKRG